MSDFSVCLSNFILEVNFVSTYKLQDLLSLFPGILLNSVDDL